MAKKIVTYVAPLLLVLSANAVTADNFTIEPVLAEADFGVLGYASGSFVKKGKLGCFKVKNARLVLNKKAEKPAEIIGFRFGLAFPVEGTYDYLAQTDLFPVNRTLSKEKQLHFNGIELCLNLPREINERNQFLSMEIHLKHNNKYGYATTYAHESKKYEKLVAKDMQKYLSDTQALVIKGKHKEALDRFLWFHDHALEHQPSMYGVRLSFALSYWKQLGDIYPPALTALVKTRDDKTLLLVQGKGNRDLFHDVMALNRTLSDDSKTVALFRKLDKNQEDMARQCWDIAQEVVINAKAYDLVRKYMGSPVGEFGEVKEMYETNKAMYGLKNFGEPFKAYNENNFVEETLRLIDVAIALEDVNAAKEIQAKALAVLDDDRLRYAVPKVEKKIHNK